MAKVLEGPGMGLMKKWGIHVPNYVVVTSVDELTKLGQANEWLKKSKLVAKAHEALGSRFKLGLVKVDLDFKAAEAATKEMIGRSVGSITVSQVIVSEMVPHKEEYYCAVKSTREGGEILVANCGGIEVESNWERVKRLCLDVGQTPRRKSWKSSQRMPVSRVPWPRKWPSSQGRCSGASIMKMRNISRSIRLYCGKAMGNWSRSTQSRCWTAMPNSAIPIGIFPLRRNSDGPIPSRNLK